MAYPDKKFVIIDSVVDLPNVASVIFKDEESSFLAGAMAAMVSQSKKLGFMGNLDIPLINKFRSGYEQGARFIIPDIELISKYSNKLDQWGAFGGEKSVAESLIRDGADIIYVNVGNIGSGGFVVFSVAKEATGDGNTVYIIYTGQNLDFWVPGIILTSVVARTDKVIENQIHALMQGNWTPGIVELGLVEDGIGITEMEFTQKEKNTLMTSNLSRGDIIQELERKIIDGSIFVTEALQPPSEWNTIPYNFEGNSLPNSNNRLNVILDLLPKIVIALLFISGSFGFGILLALVVKRNR